ncbi:PP2C family protein-serine/threonine phosphatase [Thalassobaculum fulvum]|nr:SpoIIE family protein phosphatase [Thalassobaculum fulvum]
MQEANASRASAAAERMALTRRYGLILGLAYAVLVAAAVGFFLYQTDEREKAEWRAVAGRVKEHALILDALAGAVADRVRELQEDARTGAAGVVRHGPAVDDTVVVGAQGRLEFQVGGAGNVPPTAAIAGRIGGEAFRDIRDELGMALGLLEEFRYLVTLLPIVDRAYYVSRREFAVALPATASEAEAVLDGPLGPALLRAVSPEVDRTRSPVWLDGSDLPGGGDRIVHLAPVYREDRFLGAVVLEVSTAYLNRVNGDFDYPVGTTMLIGSQGALLAYPRSSHLAVTLGAPFRTLPEGVAAAVESALTLADREFAGEGASLRYAERLEAAPWTLVYVGDRWAVLQGLVLDYGPQTLALVAVLTVMLLIAGGLTRREFVDPASRLVEHIRAAGEVGPEGPPRVPIAWRPWFRTVTAVFRENADLVRLRQELQIARDMQASVLPRQPLRHRELSIVGRMQPALEVGGDFYDYFRIDDDRVGVVIADVSGKGVPASLFMMITRTLLKAAGLSGDGPGACLERVNDLLEAENDQAMFVTVFYGVIDLSKRTLVYANGGHNPPMLLQADGTVRSVEPLGDPILAVVPGAGFREARLDLQPGDALLLYTDGLTEAFSAAGEEFGEPRLTAALAGAKGGEAAAVADHCIAAVEAFSVGAAQSDDMTCLVARISPAA